MHRGQDRFLTTHVGSLPRSPDLLKLLLAKEQGEKVEASVFRNQVNRDLRSVLEHQHRAGIDIAGDGELPRIGFSFYVKDRMSGFGGESKRGTVTDFAKFPDYAAIKLASGNKLAGSKSATIYHTPACVDRVEYDPQQYAAREELDAFSQALDGSGLEFSETFVTAATPGIISTTLLRSAEKPPYATDRDYVFALADELRKEYELIVSRGHVLQLDAPDLALERQIMFVDQPLSSFLARVELHIEALNRALINIPPDRVRLHVCWGNWDGPHIDDVEFEPLLPLLYQARVGALSLAAANPRHQHDYKLFRNMPPPREMILIPGVIDVTTNYLEHPEVVADRIERFVEAIGDRSRVIASTDCGFSTFAGYVMVGEDVAWEKLKILSEGARLASRRLW
ncbi:MAG TPA: cobalamin-independent methionine synthase II family protein [Bradyrhizobium sp.]|nr:cobalamin-independent methionine synthase II family protein [Bradyrhizobium sp.]